MVASPVSKDVYCTDIVHRQMSRVFDWLEQSFLLHMFMCTFLFIVHGPKVWPILQLYLFLCSILSELHYFQDRKLNLPFQVSYLRAWHCWNKCRSSRLLPLQSNNHLVVGANLYPIREFKLFWIILNQIARLQTVIFLVCARHLIMLKT